VTVAHRHGKGWRGSVQVPGSTSPFRKGGFTTKAAAVAWEKQTLVDLARGTYRDPDAGAVLFGVWARQWLATRTDLKRSAMISEKAIVTNHLLPRFQKVRLDEIGPLAVQTMVAEIGKARAPKTVRNVHSVLYAILELAVREGLILSNPTKGTRLPKRRRSRPQVCLTEQQVGHLVASVPVYWQPLVVTMVGTGMRWGEVAGLKVRYVDLLAGTLDVAETLNEADGVLTWDTPKSEASVRTISLPAAVVEALLPLVAGKFGEEAVFQSPRGELVRHRNFDVRVWQPACRKAGLTDPRPTPHDLRHTHAAFLIDAGVPLPEIQYRLGHESITTTVDTYGYRMKRANAAVLTALDGLLSDSVIPLPSRRQAKTPSDLHHRRSEGVLSGVSDGARTSLRYAP
jgi:integrase